MVREQGPFNLNNRWSRIAWGLIAGVCIVSFLVGFLVLGRFQQNGPTLGAWDAFCRALGITSDSQPANAPQPPRRTPTRIAWTRDTLTRIESGNAQRGAFVALNCEACHGDHGVSASALIPTLAGQNSAVLYKQLDDYRSNKRQWGVMGAIASALTDQDSADVASYFAHRPDGLAPVVGEGIPEGRPQPAAARSCPSPGVCRRSWARHPAVRGLSWSWRREAGRASASWPAHRVHRTPTRRLCPKHAAERHQRTNARDCASANTRRDAWGSRLLRCSSRSRVVLEKRADKGHDPCGPARAQKLRRDQELRAGCRSEGIACTHARRISGKSW